MCLALALGCKKTQDTSPTPAPTEAAGPGGAAGEPTPVAKLSLGELNQKLDEYKGKWVVVTAGVKKIMRQQHPDGREEATLDLLDEHGKQAGSADFAADQWAKAPKLEDGVNYAILGLSKQGKDYGAAVLKECRFVAGGASAAPLEGSVSAKDLAADASRYVGKRIQVKGVVRTGMPPTRTPPSAGVLILDGGADLKWVTVNLAAGEFDKALKAGLGAEVEVVGTLVDEKPAPSLSGCAVVKVNPADRPGRAVDFTREFARKGAAAEAGYKNKSVSLTGKVESATVGKDGTGRVVLAGYPDAKSKTPMPQKVVCKFGPDWKDAVGQVKAGDDATVSGLFAGYQPGEVTLLDCWLLPK